MIALLAGGISTYGQNGKQLNSWFSGSIVVNKDHKFHQFEGVFKADDHFVLHANQGVFRYTFLSEVKPNCYIGGGLGLFDSRSSTLSNWQLEVRPFLQLNYTFLLHQWKVRFKYRSELRWYTVNGNDAWRNRFQIMGTRRIGKSPFSFFVSNELLVTLSNVRPWENRIQSGFQWELSDQSLVTWNYMLQMNQQKPLQHIVQFSYLYRINIK